MCSFSFYIVIYYLLSIMRQVEEKISWIIARGFLAIGESQASCYLSMIQLGTLSLCTALIHCILRSCAPGLLSIFIHSSNCNIRLFPSLTYNEGAHTILHESSFAQLICLSIFTVILCFNLFLVMFVFSWLCFLFIPRHQYVFIWIAVKLARVDCDTIVEFGTFNQN